MNRHNLGVLHLKGFRQVLHRFSEDLQAPYDRILRPDIGDELAIGHIGGILKDSPDSLSDVAAEKADVRALRHT